MIPPHLPAEYDIPKSAGNFLVPGGDVMYLYGASRERTRLNFVQFNFLKSTTYERTWEQTYEQASDRKHPRRIERHRKKDGERIDERAFESTAGQAVERADH